MATGLFTLRQQLQALAQKAWSGTQKTNFVEYLVVAGGGSGGALSAGGAGGLLVGLAGITPGSAVTVTIGAGGALSGGGQTGQNGVNSLFGSVTATGGGAGAWEAGVNWATVPGNSGGSGGSASPAYTNANNGYRAAGQGISGQGNSAGVAAPLSGDLTQTNSGGGGGAGTVGRAATPARAGDGGAGIASAISGTVTVYAGGGGGGTWSGVSGSGGVGGGGNGGGGNGSANTGGGGGNGGNGGSGIVIIRYPNTFADATSVTNGTKTSITGWTVYTFTSSGSITI